MTTHELILYLTPTGPLAEICDEYFAIANRRFGRTAASPYPPHITLTGFFRRSTARREAIVADVQRAQTDLGPLPPDGVTVVGMHTSDTWVGLEVQSPWAKRFTGHLIDVHGAIGDEDALRPKDWLHLSLAYGLADDQRLHDYAELASEIVDPSAGVQWELAIWQRHSDHTWTHYV